MTKRELEDKLAEKMSSLLGKKFKENPAYKKALWEVYSMIPTDKVFSFRESANTISLDFKPNLGEAGEQFSVTIVVDETCLRCTKITDKNPFISTIDGNLVNWKESKEIIANIDDAGWLKIQNNFSMLSNDNCKQGECNNNIFSERCEYTDKGVMQNRYTKSVEEKYNKDINYADVDSMLFIPRQLFKMGFNYNCTKETILRREKLDTARYIVKENEEVTYSSTIPLDQQNGLSDMIISNYSSSDFDIIINPLSKEEIDAMLQKESDPIVREGLRKYADGRESYFYDSKEDPYYVSKNRTGISR